MSLISRLFVVLALVAAPLAFVAPADAASGIDVRTTVAAVEPATSTSHHKVYLWAHCSVSKTCSGRATIQGQTRNFTWPYSIKAGQSGYILVYWLRDAGNDQPTGLGAYPGVDGTTLKRTLWVDPSNASPFTKSISLERRQATRRLKGTVVGNGGSRVTNLEVTRWYVSGLVSRRLRTVSVSGDGSYDLGSFTLGRNNASTSAYRVSVSARVDGTEREWFWRGDPSGAGTTTGGGKMVREAHAVVINKYRDFQANFRYGTLSGDLSGSGAASAEVRVVAPPVSMPGATSDRRGLDVPYCANEFGADAASSGHYSVTFLPKSDNGDRRYLVVVNPTGSAEEATIGGGGQVYASCHAAKKYSDDTSDDDLISYTSGSSSWPVGLVNIDGDNRAVSMNMNTSTSLVTQDKWATVREYVPGTKILDRPILQAGYTDGNGFKTFTGLRPGKYWVEVGRRVGCSAWYPSIYHNNDAYLEGSDRGNEAWKTVDGKYPEYNTSYKYGYVAKTPPRGYVGWMYRDVCRADSAGKFVLVSSMSGTPAQQVVTLSKGATISGHVSRAGGKSNKEMLVSAYSTGGVLVMRSAYTNSRGDFRIRGLASGNYRILVNGDSWRGIGRNFSGTHTKRVSAGNAYSVGTLRFTG
jgi:hypothetical protein